MIRGSEVRKPGHPVEALFLDRWSPRAMSGEPIDPADLMSMFEAARWAPSSFNNQPWRMFYALRETPNWALYFDLLADANKAWVQRASALVLFVAKTTFDHNGKPSLTHAFDTGAAWENFALQGTLRGLVVHPMQGFDYARARDVLGIPEDHAVMAMVAVGKPGGEELLAEDARKRDVPNGRRALSEIVFEGRFPVR